MKFRTLKAVLFLSLMIFQGQSARASQDLQVETSEGTRYECDATSEVIENERSTRTCKSQSGTLFLMNDPIGWSAVEKKSPHHSPRLASVKSVKAGKRLLFASSAKDVPQNQSLKSRSEEASTALSLMEWSLQSKKDRVLWGKFKEEARAEVQEVDRLIKGNTAAEFELSDGTTLLCKRAPSVNEAQLCEYYLCPKVKHGEKGYDALIRAPDLGGSGVAPSVILSSQKEFGPDLGIYKSYIIDSKGNRSLFDEIPRVGKDATFYADSKQTLPQEYRDRCETLKIFDNSASKDSRNDAAQRCRSNDVERILKQEEAAYQQTQEQLAKIEVVQVVEWIGGQFQSKLMPLLNVPSKACIVEKGIYFNSESVSDYQKYKREFISAPASVITELRAHALFNELAQMKDIPFEHQADGCYARAQVMCDRLKEMGIVSQKIWKFGQLSPKDRPDISWWYHVATSVEVKLQDGRIEKRIIDPSLSNRLLTVSEWSHLIENHPPGEPIETRFPPTTNKNFLGRSQLSVSPPDFFIPDNKPYDHARASEEAKQTNAEYLELIKKRIGSGI